MRVRVPWGAPFQHQEEKMQQYKCHKTVKAFKILEILWDETNHAMMIQGDGEHDEIGSMFFKSQEWCDTHKAKAGGYFVEYEDGYHSFSPAEAFESGYVIIGQSGNGGEESVQMMREVVSSLAIANEKLDRLFNQHSLKEAIDALEYIESYLEGAVDSEDVDGLLMSARPILHDVRKFLNRKDGV